MLHCDPPCLFGLLRGLGVQGSNTRRAPVHPITVGDEPQARQAYDLNGNRAKSCGISIPSPILSGGEGRLYRLGKWDALPARDLTAARAATPLHRRAAS